MTAKILVVDDEPLNLEIVAEYFEDTGYDLVCLDSGEAAWSALSADNARFDLLILDRMMPGLDGMSLLKRIKADAHLAILPVIMQTAASSPQQLREGLQAGVFYYLTKPYEKEALLSVVRTTLSDTAAKSELRQRLRAQNNAFQLLCEGHFEMRTLEDASRLATLLAQAAPCPENAVLGLSELLLNSVEHGNLGVTYAEKSELKRQDRWQEEIGRRLTLAENSDKRVRVHLKREADRLQIRISDEGTGFDWHRYLDFDPERALDPNGRGIALARLSSFDHIEYQGCGNTVIATILDKPSDAEK